MQLQELVKGWSINDALLTIAESRIQTICRGTAKQQAIRLVCRAGDEGFPLTKENRANIATALYELYWDGLIIRTVDWEDPPIWILHPTPLARHIALLLETTPAPGKSALLTVMALRDADRKGAS